MIGFGQVDRVAARLAEIAGRDVRGTAATKVSFAREGLALLTTHHEMATFSGPEALKMYLTVAPVRTLEASVRTIAAYHPAMAGTSLADLRALAQSAGLELEMVHAAPVGEIPVPSVVHLRSEHYSAVIGEQDGAYILRDPGLGGTFVMSGAALRNEASGYFLVSPAVAASMIARRVSEGEAASVLGHCTPGAPASGDPPCPSCGGPGPGPGGMPSYTFHPNKVSLLLEDVPLGYTPAVGPAINLHLSYDHRDGRQPQTLDYGHVGRVWSHNWLSFVTDNLYQILPPYASETVMLRGHGHETYAGGATPTHQISRAALVKVSHDPPRFERRLPDGTVEVFTQADRAATQLGRRTFLTQVVDPQGHAVSLTYDSTVRLVAIADALGQVTTLEYLDVADPLRITRVTDPFGRVATLTYDTQGRLETMTDVAGMTSRLSYGAADFVASMTTPYGTTTFRHEPVASTTSNFRRIEATDPAGGTERLEFHHQHNAIATTAPASEVPAGFSASNAALHLYNSLYWDKPAMAAGGGSLSTAVITSWMLASDLPGGHGWSRNIPHSIKRPLESRVWYRYPDQGAASHHSLGTGTAPALIGRVLDGGASQITAMTYNTQGMVTSRIDPIGRQTNYTYATNGIDQLTVEQVRSGGTDVLQSYAGYNSQHLPESITDAAGQETTMTYNAAGQPLTVTNAKNETTTYTYQTGTGSLLSATGPVSGATTSYTYDAYGRVESVADSDGYAVISDYDNLNRLIARTYPDDTTETLTYSRLDLTEQKDRLGRITRHLYDGFGRRIATRDPAGRTISQIWCPCGSMEALVDANGNRTKWERDVQGRVTREVRADNTTDTLSTYDLSGRLKTVTDPKDQVTTHSYNVDDSLSGTAYTNDVIETPNVSYTYDPYYARVATMVDGIGTTTYAYKAAGANGAGQVASVDGPLSNDTITYTYDELGRVTERAINGAANTVTWAFDTLGRVTSEVNVLGAFTYTYDGVTSRLATVAYPNSQTSTYSYLNNLGDHRLQTIHHKYPNASTLSKFDYTYDTVGNILTWRQQADTTAVMWEYGYDPADQLVSAVKKSTATPATILQRFAYGYDPGGNRTIEQNDDAVTLSAYDNLNRLMNQAPGGPMMIDGSLNEPGTVTISGVRAIVDANNNFRGTVPTATGTNTFTIVAKDATGNATTQQYEVDVAGTGKTFSYDANGNLTSDGSRAFEWNALNQVVAAEAGSHRTEYSYDAQRRRVLEIDKIAGVTTRTVREVWCEMAICEDRGFDGQTVSRNLFPLGEREGLNSRYHAPTHLGAPAAVSDDDAAIISRYAFGPWGRRTLETGSDVTERGSGGHKILDNASISLSVHRAYDFETERWLSEDPAGMIDGPNLYSYVSNQPIGRIDPSGLCGCGDECPSGEWKLHTIGFEGGAPGLTFMAGAGVLACNGKSVMKTVKVFCSTMGLYVSAGISVSWQFRGASLTDTCNRSDIKEFKTVARVSTSGTLSLSGGHKDPNTVGLTLGPGSLGAGMSVCRVVPW